MSLRLAMATIVICTSALARDNGQYKDVPEDIRNWFKSIRSPQGIPCCDISDGHRTDYDMRDNKYWVPINGQWVMVPPETVLKEINNPTGDAIVWYTMYDNKPFIRCFVPSGGA